MIKINLLDRKKPFKIPVIAGINIYEIQPRPLIVAFCIYYIVDGYTLPFLERDLRAPTQERDQLKKDSRALRKDLARDKELEKKMSAFDEQIQKLKKREKEVEQIMAQRSNPKNILSEISKRVPEDLWIDELIIKDKYNVEISGGAISYASLSTFIEKVRKLQYFSGNLVPKETKTESINYFGKTVRASKFKAEGRIVTFGDF